MRGKNPEQASMLALVSIESLVPEKHPIRAIKPVVDGVLRELSPRLDTLYAATGRPSVPPERLLKSMVLIALFSVRSERMFCERLGYDMLFRWFLDMEILDVPFDPTTFTQNRDRLLNTEVARLFFDQVREYAERQNLMSNEHFSVDGTLIQAWASMKSFRRKDDDSGDNNGFGDFKGTKRSNDTHESKTDPDAKLFRKGRGQEAKLAFMAHALMENRHGLIRDFEVTAANGTAERDAGIDMLDRMRARQGTAKPRRATVGADKAYDTKDFVAKCRARRVTPHVAQNVHARRTSAIDARVTAQPGYAMSQRARMLIEKIFGWLKTIGGLRRTRFRGRLRASAQALFAASAFNLLRITQLLQPA
jgi:transposase